MYSISAQISDSKSLEGTIQALPSRSAEPQKDGHFVACAGALNPEGRRSAVPMKAQGRSPLMLQKWRIGIMERDGDNEAIPVDHEAAQIANGVAMSGGWPGTKAVGGCSRGSGQWGGDER